MSLHGSLVRVDRKLCNEYIGNKPIYPHSFSASHPKHCTRSTSIPLPVTVLVPPQSKSYNTYYICSPSYYPVALPSIESTQHVLSKKCSLARSVVPEPVPVLTIVLIFFNVYQAWNLLFLRYLNYYNFMNDI